MLGFWRAITLSSVPWYSQKNLIPDISGFPNYFLLLIDWADEGEQLCFLSCSIHSKHSWFMSVWGSWGTEVVLMNILPLFMKKWSSMQSRSGNFAQQTMPWVVYESDCGYTEERWCWSNAISIWFKLLWECVSCNERKAEDVVSSSSRSFLTSELVTRFCCLIILESVSWSSKSVVGNL